MSDTTTTTPATLPAETVPAPYKPWRDKKVILTSALAMVLAAAMALTAYLTLFSGSSGAAGVLARDGYATVKTLSHDQLAKLAGSDKDAQLGASMFDSAVAGTKGTKAEIVLKLTDVGKAFVGNPLMAGVIAGSGGTTAHVIDGGRYLVVNGTASQLGGTWLK